MGRRNDRWAPPARGGMPPTEPVEVVDLYPNPQLAPRPPETRATILADLHAGFASLSDDELKVAQLWVYGRSLADVSHFLKLDEDTAHKLWKRMRRKLRTALVVGAARTPDAAPISPAPRPSTGTPQGTGGTSPA